MNGLQIDDTRALRHSIGLEPCEPLWKRAPGRDESGRPLSDFLMIIPRLSRQPADVIRTKLGHIQRVLERYGKVVVFADMNLRLNTLWVTVRPVPGITLELPAVIKLHVPEALLVAPDQRAYMGRR
ncbi:MAG TPA: hypothetical protein ENN42_02785 [Thioalkalivibrio sp.]|nr:hypothetical protein [Thioalkalivibrio sp.]